MSKTLNGNTSLNIDQVPKKQKKLGLVHKPPKSEMRAFRLSRHAILAIENLSKRFTFEHKVKISMAKIIELSIFNAENKTLEELLQVDK